MQVGEIVGNYRIAGELGAGDVGAVYLARHTLIGREAAIQVLPPELCGNAAAVAHFLSEAKNTAGIKHPGIAEVYDSGYTRDGRAYLVMERLEGESLGARLRSKGQLSLEQAVAIARQVSGALYAAHKIGIVHRGLKPDSITLVSDPDVPGGERAKILGFGVAKLRESAESGDLEAAYLAPEQCDGSDRIDHRADLYALGCILFELVCGRPPFDGMSRGVVLAQHMRETPPAPSSIEPSVGRDLDQMILRLLEKDPERRFPDAFELLTKFHELSGLAAPAAPVPGSNTMLNTPPPDGPSGVANPTVSGVVSSARRTLALGPRYRGAAQGALPRTVTVAAGTQRRTHPREDDTAEPDDVHEETIDRDATQDDDLPTAGATGDPPFGPMLDESSRGGLFNDPSVDRLLPLPPAPPSTPYTRQAMADAAAGPAPVGATQMMGSGSSGPPRSAARIAPGTAAVPVSAAPPGPPPPPGSSGRPPGGGSGGPGGPPPPPGAMGRTMAMPPGPPPGGPPPGPPSGPPPSTQPAGKSREPFGGTGDLIMTLPAFSPGDMPGSPGGPAPGGPSVPEGGRPGPHGGPPGSHGGPPGSHGSPPPGAFPSPPPGAFPSPPPGSHGRPDPSAMGGAPFPPPFPPGPPGASGGPHGGPPPGSFGPGGPPPPAPPLGGPPPPAPPLGPGGPRDFGPPPHNAPPVFNEPFPRPMVRREDAMRAGMHVPPPRPSGTSSQAVRIGGLIVAVALGIGVVSAYVVATSDDDETEGSGQGTGATVAAAGATGAPATLLDAGAAGDKAASAASDASAGDPARSAATDVAAGAAADAGARAAADKPAAGDPAAGDRSAADDKAGADKAGDDSADKPAADKPAADKPAADKPAADKPAADKVAAADDSAADKPATVETAPADAPSDRAPSEPVEDKETRRRPAALITLQIDSLPRGAAVIRKRDGVRLGETPFTYQTEPQSSPVAIILRHRGYRDETLTLPGNRSSERRVPLTRTDGRDRAPSLKD